MSKVCRTAFFDQVLLIILLFKLKYLFLNSNFHKSSQIKNNTRMLTLCKRLHVDPPN